MKCIQQCLALARNTILCCAAMSQRKKKAVLLLSTMHFDRRMQEEEPFKPHVILDYNATKGGVDQLDQLDKNYSCKRITNRWPLIIFYWMVDVAAYNSSVYFMEENLSVYQGNQRRRKFLVDLSEQLCIPQIQGRSESVIRYLPKHVVECMEAFVSDNGAAAPKPHPQERRKRRCGKWPRKMD